MASHAGMVLVRLAGVHCFISTPCAVIMVVRRTDRVGATVWQQERHPVLGGKVAVFTFSPLPPVCHGYCVTDFSLRFVH